jgi:molecular chaperone DnaK (HSP70)
MTGGQVAYGIDLGTTYSVLATVDGRGQAVVIPNRLGQLMTPSVVTFADASTVFVGSVAKSAAVTMPDRTVSLIKRRMGIEHPLYFDDVEHTPESVSALILRSLVDPVREDGQQVRAVVTVPAYFGVREREATQQACVLAGIEVLDLVSEPVAAAIHYDFAATPGAYLVYDLGGGTFDGTVLTTGDTTTVVATDGDTELGGADWDTRLAEHLLAEVARSGVDDPGEDEAFVAEVALLAERIKRELSDVQARTVALRYRGSTVTVTVDRHHFDAMCRDLAERTHGYVRRLLGAAERKGVSSIDRALLVGGSSRMPMIAAGLAEAFGWPVELHDPDLAVAKGAALRAAQLTGGERSLVSGAAGSLALRKAGHGAITPVVPRGFGLLLNDSHESSGRRDRVQHVIHQNDPLPVQAREVVVATILDNQTTARIEVWEQAGAAESPDVAANRRVLDGQLIGLPPLPAGSAIRVSFHLGLDGLLGVTAVEPRSGQSLELEACIDGVLDGGTRSRLAGALSALKIRH